MSSDGMTRIETIGTSLLCVFLLVAGIRMCTTVATMRRAKLMQTDAATTRTVATFSSENGIDINGHPVIPMPPPFEQKAVIFLLHSSTLTEDLHFWAEVSRNLSERSGIRLVAYCNDDECARLVRDHSSSLPFTVVKYAEVKSGEALIEADARGDSIIRSEEWLAPQMSNWRTFKRTPQQFSEAISRL